MSPLPIVAAGLVGLIVGWVVAHLLSRARRGSPPLAPSLAGRRTICGIGTAGAFAAVTWWMLSRGGPPGVPGTPGIDRAAPAAILLAYLVLAAGGVVLALVDLDTHRLPDALVLPGYAVLPGLLSAAVLFGAPPEALVRALCGGAAVFSFYALLRAIRPGAMGGGDVKLSGVLGIALGFAGWNALIVGAVAAFVLGGAVGVALLAVRRAHLQTALPFGPWMILGAWIGLFAGEHLVLPVRAAPLAG